MRFCTALLVLINGACLTTSPNNLKVQIDGAAANEIKHINKNLISGEQAITIANKNAAKKPHAVGNFQTISCERETMWVIIYDGGGPEYYVDKFTGAILLVKQLPLNINGTTPDAPAVADHPVTKEEAVEIARKQFVDFLVSQKSDGEQVNKFDAVPCELTQGWRVFFDYKLSPGETMATAPNVNPPNYLIDKKTRGILYTTHQITK